MHVRLDFGRVMARAGVSTSVDFTRDISDIKRSSCEEHTQKKPWKVLESRAMLNDHDMRIKASE